MKILALLFVAMLSSSCFSPVDETVYKPITSKPNIQQLAGKWKADSGSYVLIKKKKVYKIDSLYLVLHEDSTFEVVNLPDCVADGLGNPVKGKLHNTSGSWEIENTRSNRKSWNVGLNFSHSELYKNGLRTEYALYMKDSKFVLICFVGDPDQGEQLLFVKE